MEEAEALAPLQTRLVPTLVSIMDSQAEKVTPGLQAVALGTSSHGSVYRAGQKNGS